MCDVQARFANLLRESNVAIHDARFSSRRHSTQPETKAGGAFVHGSVFGEARILGMLHHRQVQFSAESQRRAHDFVFEDRLAVVGNGNCAGALQCGKVGERRSARVESRRAAMGKTLTTAPRSGCRNQATHSACLRRARYSAWCKPR